MKSNVVVKEMLICQDFQFPAIWTSATFLSNQIYVLQFCLINCEAVGVKSFDHFLLVNTKIF